MITHRSRWATSVSICFAIGLTSVMGGCAGTYSNGAPPRPTSSHHITHSLLLGLKVKGSKIVSDSGKRVFLIGVNRSGNEYSCIQNGGIFDGPSDDASIAAMAAWHVNMVRILLNEDCWLGINRTPVTDSKFGCSANTTLPNAYFGKQYRAAIVNYVNMLHRHGMYAQVSLMWGAPGKCRALFQPPGPDAAHSPAMWKSMADAFKNDPNVILAPWGETTTSWACFMHGCADGATYGTTKAGYGIAGMQQAVDVMRKAGYHGIIAIPCIDYANVCAGFDGSSWLKSHPYDPEHQLIAEAHVYGNDICGAQHNGACLEAQYGVLAKKFPMLWSEVGDSYDGSVCSGDNMRILLPWADRRISGYLVWTWDTWEKCALIRNYAVPTPLNGFASYVKAHFAKIASESKVH